MILINFVEFCIKESFIRKINYEGGKAKDKSLLRISMKKTTDKTNSKASKNTKSSKNSSCSSKAKSQTKDCN